MTTDLDEAKRLYLKACDGSQLHGCQYLGNLYRDAGDVANAITYFKKGCILGDSASCSNLAALGSHP